MDWTTRSGFLEKKSNILRQWHLRYFVLSERVLSSFADESQKVQTGRLEIDDATTIEALPNEEPDRMNIFTVRNQRNETFTMNASDAQDLEIWMISLIQSIYGEFAPSENFFSGKDDDDGQSGHGDVAVHDLRRLSEGLMCFPMKGYMKKQGHKTGIWKERFFMLDETRLFRYYRSHHDTSPEAMRQAVSNQNNKLIFLH